MDIILWRHAEAEDLAANDLARPLTKRGEKQAARMARWLNSRIGDSGHLSDHWRVIASPAVRAQMTAAALETPIETVAAIAPDATPVAILRAAGWPDNSKSVIVVGHQPTLGMVAALLINGVDGYVAVKKGAIWWFRTSPHKGENIGDKAVLVAMMTPDTVKD